jgi:hypothetical protein
VRLFQFAYAERLEKSRCVSGFIAGRLTPFQAFQDLTVPGHGGRVPSALSAWLRVGFPTVESTPYFSVLEAPSPISANASPIVAASPELG